MKFVTFMVLGIRIDVWLVGITVFLFAFNYIKRRIQNKLPPGPFALPVIGTLQLFMTSDIRETLSQMTNKYSDVFTVFLGPSPVVVLNGYDAIYDAFVKKGQVFSGRPKTFSFTVTGEGYGIISTEGSAWCEQRRHTFHILRDVGRTILEERILEEVDVFISEMDKYNNKPFYPAPLVQMSIANVIASVMFGKRMDYNDPVFKKYIEFFNRLIKVIGYSGIVNAFPFVSYLPGDMFQVKQLKRDLKYMRLEYKRRIDEHRQAAKEGKQVNDFISAYLKKMEDEKNVENSTFTEKQLIAICNDLFTAGTETTSLTLVWIIIFLCLNQDIQDRVHAEIDDVIGQEALPRMHHRLRLPFTEACILETQRLADIAPFGVPHAATEDVHFRGYFIPKGTQLLPNLYSVHMNSNLWPEPKKFKPDRFLDNKSRISKKELIPFSVGKRFCVGEGLAKMEIFLYITRMMQQLRFKPAPGYPIPETRGDIGILHTPKLFHVIVEARRIR